MPTILTEVIGNFAMAGDVSSLASLFSTAALSQPQFITAEVNSALQAQSAQASSNASTSGTPSSSAAPETSDQLEASALSQFSTLLLGASNALTPLTTAGGSGALNTVTSSNTSVLTAAADSTAKPAAYQITVNSLANSGLASFGSVYSSADSSFLSDPTQSGTVSVTVGSGNNAKLISVNVDGSTTAGDFVDAFNAQSFGNATASLVQTTDQNGNTGYQITIQSNATGVSQGSLAVTSDNPSLLPGGVNVQQATDASFSLGGVGTITRGSNLISDVIPGVTFALQQPGYSSLSVSSSTSQIETQLSQFVAAYNQAVTYDNSQKGVTDGSSDSSSDGSTDSSDPSSDSSDIQIGALNDTSVDSDALNAVQGAIYSAASQDGTITAASLGISVNEDGTLSFDKSQLESSYATNQTGVLQAVSSLADSIASNATGVIPSYASYGGTIQNVSQYLQPSFDPSPVSDDVTTAASTASTAEANQVNTTQFQYYLQQLSAGSDYLSQLLNFSS